MKYVIYFFREVLDANLVTLALSREVILSRKKSIIWKDWKNLNRSITDEYYAILCKRIQNEDKAKITVILKGPTFKKYRRSLRVTFTDRLGSIGGTLGLFSGFSLMAIIELIHWICKVSCSLMLKNRMVVQNPV